jgi:hypothetical protein
LRQREELTHPAASHFARGARPLAATAHHIRRPADLGQNGAIAAMRKTPSRRVPYGVRRAIMQPAALALCDPMQAPLQKSQTQLASSTGVIPPRLTSRHPRMPVASDSRRAANHVKIRDWPPSLHSPTFHPRKFLWTSTNRSQRSPLRNSRPPARARRRQLRSACCCASQATAIAVSVLLRHLRSPELVKLLSSAFENHQAVMLQTPWPDPMLQAFESTRRFLEGAAQAELPGSPSQPETPAA